MIKNKDGTTYKLTGHNILKNQEFWLSDPDVVLYNFKKHKPEITTITPIIIGEYQQPLERRSGLTKIYCLPVIFENIKDDIYGSVYSKSKFGEKFIFEGVIVGCNDLQIFIKTKEDVNPGSIIFPTGGGKNNDGRWWEITEKAQESNEFTMTGVVSSLQPDFS